ncbi:ABC transporter substrate-binding protein [Streptomyces blattellae]|uniref:ABC transporter substrate-binding protein n=1 Tax=Streptomyces blattellae TaxID=2569855 RepID=UPI0018ACD565|nr:ABC transporter substrate-binding protein [Streptomyces blattellae]
MSTRFRSGAVISLIATTMVVSACGGDDDGSASAESSGKSTVTIAFQPASATSCLKVTDERGIFAKHGITMKFAAAATGSGSIPQILNGQITMGVGSPTAVLSAVSSDLPVVITSGVDQDFDRDGVTAVAAIVGKGSDIKSFKDLEGKTVAVNSLQGNWDVTLKEAVAKSGGDPDKVKLVAVPFADQAAALKSGRADAVYTLNPFAAQLLDEGHVSIGDPQAVAFDQPDAATSVAFMSKQFVDDNPDVVQNFNAALEEGNEWCNSHPDDMRKAIARITEVPQAVVDATPLPAYATGIEPSEMDDLGELLVKYGVLKESPSSDEVTWSGVPAK